MKIKVITRAAEDFTRERKSDVVKVFKNPDPVIHPFERSALEGPVHGLADWAHPSWRPLRGPRCLLLAT